MNYYNENDKQAAQWLRNLIQDGMLPQGDVDERSIEDVCASDLKGFTQHHFFAGIGGWSEALRLAGWQANQPVWTGSCPCQSFSSAGQQKGFDDPRHLWPVWFKLIEECRPPVIFGEQVAAAIKHGWLDLVQNDLERENYACGALVLPACSVGAPQKRDRLWFMAYRIGKGLEGWESVKRTSKQSVGARGLAGGLANSHLYSNREKVVKGNGSAQAMESLIGEEDCSPGLFRRASIDGCSVGNSASRACSQEPDTSQESQREAGGSGLFINSELSNDHWATAGFWGDADWILCTDGAARPVEPRTLPLADGVQGRMVKIRGYGNAIVPQVAAEVIKAGLAYLLQKK
ncbi:MAG: DNA cytosine methyltransferase [Saezia sp.]